MFRAGECQPCWMHGARMRKGRPTDMIFVIFASGDIELALWETPLSVGGVENVTGISSTEQENVGINALGEVFGEVHSGTEAAHLEWLDQVARHRRVQRAVLHCIGMST